MPTGIEFAMPADADAISPFPKILQMIECGLHFHLIANDTNIVLHHFLQILLDLVRILTGVSLKWRHCFARDNLDCFIVSSAVLIFPREFGGEFPGACRKNDDIGEGIAADAVGAISTGGLFPRSEHAEHA